MKLDACVAGVGMTRFGKHLESGLKALGAEAVRAGALVSVAGGIDRCLDQIESGFEEPVEILLTGGDAELVSALLVHNCAIIPNLVLIGLALVAQDELI